TKRGISRARMTTVSPAIDSTQVQPLAAGRPTAVKISWTLARIQATTHYSGQSRLTIHSIPVSALQRSFTIVHRALVQRSARHDVCDPSHPAGPLSDGDCALDVLQLRPSPRWMDFDLASRADPGTWSTPPCVSGLPRSMRHPVNTIPLRTP